MVSECPETAAAAAAAAFHPLTARVRHEKSVDGQREREREKKGKKEREEERQGEQADLQLSLPLFQTRCQKYSDSENKWRNNAVAAAKLQLNVQRKLATVTEVSALPPRKHYFLSHALLHVDISSENGWCGKDFISINPIK